MRGGHWWLVGLFAATAAVAQLHLPGVPLGLPQWPAVTRGVDALESRSLDTLAAQRRLLVDRLVRANRGLLDTDPQGEPVVRAEVLALSPSDAALAAAAAAGFTVAREARLADTGIRVVVLRAPGRLSTAKALRGLRRLDAAGEYDYNHVYSGGGLPRAAPTAGGAPAPSASAPPAADTRAARVGLIDTGVEAGHPAFRGATFHPWGCDGAAIPGAHGTAVASLLVAHGAAQIYAADVYCGKPTGGAVDVIVRALGWMLDQRIGVINVSLVGPRNALLERVVGLLVARGHLIVAAVGNDGPAAPPLYPAAYAGVIGVTGVDAHRRVLIEALRGPQVMFAARGTDLTAAAPGGATAAVRGTSFAAPTVAALLAPLLPQPDRAGAGAALDALVREAVDLGPSGRDPIYGFGLVGAAEE